LFFHKINERRITSAHLLFRIRVIVINTHKVLIIYPAKHIDIFLILDVPDIAYYHVISNIEFVVAMV